MGRTGLLIFLWREIALEANAAPLPVLSTQPEARPEEA